MYYSGCVINNKACVVVGFVFCGIGKVASTCNKRSLLVEHGRPDNRQNRHGGAQHGTVYQTYGCVYHQPPH